MSPMPTRPKVLAISSGGGHWTELLRLRPAFDECDVTFATVQSDYRDDVAPSSFTLVPDATRWQKLRLVHLIAKVFILLIRIRPDVIVTTGAAPGFVAIRLGRLFRIPSCWIDSIANAEELSLSGKKATAIASLTLSQWQHVADSEGVEYAGAIL